ncbi:MAG: DNA translocase FtsK 4TM domain-containing protein, partial [Limnohabitans sp.]
MTYSLHTLNNDRRANSPDGDLKPTGFRRFAQEIALTAGFVFMTFWLLALLTHSPQDPAWSTSGTGVGVHNFGGRFGAWLGDLSFFLLGYSVWWCFAAGLVSWLAALANRLREDSDSDADTATDTHSWRHTRFAFWAGLTLLLISSVGLEWTRMYRFEANLPGHISGGVLGYLVGPFSLQWLGFNGSGLIFIVFGVVGASWVFRFSWSQTAENLGAWIDGWIEAWRERREREQDLAYGLVAAREREEIVHVEREEIEEHPPVAVVLESEKVDMPKSARVAKERQKPLFNDMMDSRLPQVDLLDGAVARQDTVSPDTLEMTSRMIEKKLKDFGVEVRVVAASPGPVITRYEIEPATGVKGSQVVNLAKDLARSLSLVSIRVVETIPGKNYMALELPNAKRQTIRLSEILGSDVYNEAKSMLTMGLGKDIVGNPVVADLAKMPHVLVAGTTGSGKSVGINAMILSLLYKA